MADILLEIGTEEVPVNSQPLAISQMKSAFAQKLADARVSFEAIEGYHTPRRLVIKVTGVAENQADITRENKGPSAQVAFKEGKPTPAAMGFAKKQGVDVSELKLVETPQGSYVAVDVFEKGRPSGDVFAEMVPDVLKSLTFPKMMRWGWSSIRFVRPIRWMVALCGDDVLPIEIEGVVSGRNSKGHRFLHLQPVEIKCIADYAKSLESAYVIVDQDARQQMIVEQANAVAAAAGASVAWEADHLQELLEEVTNLVEYPTAVVGQFEEEYLELPDVVLITAMKKHQRYFPLRNAEGALINAFVAIRNGNSDHLQIVKEGYETVLRARFNDARFFFERDLAHRLEAFVPKLERMVFQEKLGTLLARTHRLMALAGQYAELVGVEEADAVRAAELCKADQATEMVMELPALQGYVGREYALRSGEKAEVAEAILEHYLPRSSGGALPGSDLGRFLAALDRADTLVGYVCAQKIVPKGSGDPFGLRRAAQGLLNLLSAHPHMPDLCSLVNSAANVYKTQGIEVSEEGIQLLLELCAGRLGVILEEDGCNNDQMQALLVDNLEPRFTRAKGAVMRTAELDTFIPLVQAATRVRNILKSGEASNMIDTTQAGCPKCWWEQVNAAKLEKDAEKALLQAIKDTRPLIHQAVHAEDAGTLLSALQNLVGPVNTFFHDVKVMDDDADVKKNRLVILASADAMFRRFAEFSKLSL